MTHLMVRKSKLEILPATYVSIFLYLCDLYMFLTIFWGASQKSKPETSKIALLQTLVLMDPTNRKKPELFDDDGRR